MATKRKYTSKRKYGKKTTFAKVKRSMVKTKKAKAVKNMDTKFVKSVIDVIISPTQGISVSNYIYNNWQLLQATSNPYSVLNTNNYRVNAAMYDRVRINSMKITYTPKANTFDAAVAQNDSAFTLNGSGQIYSAIDRDSTLPWLSSGMIPAWQQYPSCKQTSILKKHSRSYSVKYMKGIWLDTANIFEDNTLLHRMGLFGNIGVYAENLVEDKGEIYNEPYGTVKLEYTMVFQGTKPTSVAVDANGVITITPIEPDPSDKLKETWAPPVQDINGDEVI